MSVSSLDHDVLTLRVQPQRINPMFSGNDYLPDRLHFSMFGMYGEIFSFSWDDGTLWMAWDEKQDATFSEPRSMTPDEHAWLSFWSQVNVIGVWHWRKEYWPKDIVILDGAQWSLELSYQGRTVSCFGSNAYPPDNRLEFSEAFKQLLRAFGRLCSDENFVNYWYYGAVSNTDIT